MLFGKFLLSYVCILLVPLFIGLYAYQQTVGVIREDAAQMNRAVLEQSEDALNRMLGEIKEIVALLSLDSEVLRLMITADRDWTPQTLFQFSQMQKNELNLLSTNHSIANLFVYFSNSEAVISQKTVQRIGDLPLQMDGRPFGEWLKQVIGQKRVNQYLRVENVWDGQTTQNYLAYISTMPASNQFIIDGAVIILIEEKTIAKLFKDLVVERESYALIRNEHDEVMIAVNADELAAQPAGHSAALDSFVRVQGTELFVTSYPSKTNKWTYQIGVPAEKMFAKADYIKRINWLVVGMALFLGTLIAFLFAYKSSKPIAEIHDSVQEHVQGELWRHGNVFDVVKHTLRSLVHDNQAMNNRMREQSIVLRLACLERMIKGRFINESELVRYMEQAGLELPDGRCGVVVIRLVSNPYVNESGMDKSLMVYAMQLRLEQLFGDHGFVCQLYEEQLAVLFFADKLDEQERLAVWVSSLEQLQADWLREYNSTTIVSIGLLYEHVLDAWRSYNEAMQAIDSGVRTDASRLIRYECFPQQALAYYYPLDFEMNIMKTVKLGDIEGLQQLLEQLERQNYQLRQLSVRRERQLFSELQGTLQKIAEQLSYLSLEFNWDSHGTELLESSEFSFKRIKETLLSICQAVVNQRSVKQSELFEWMKAYIGKHFCSYELSLSALAEACKQSESFVSTFFKEHMGVTFSEYVEQLRLSEAARLLKQSESPIHEIALCVGYGNDKSFRRAFKRAYGIQPTLFRSNSGQERH